MVVAPFFVGKVKENGEGGIRVYALLRCGFQSLPGNSPLISAWVEYREEVVPMD